MTTLELIQDQKAKVDRESSELRILQARYVNEKAKYKKGDIVLFREKYSTNIKRGTIRHASFYDDNKHDSFIRYEIRVLNKNLLPSNKQRSLESVHEDFITKKINNDSI